MTNLLVDLKTAAEMLGGISPWTLRAYCERGWLTPVKLPSARRSGEFSRRVLFDVEDLKAFIRKQKESV